MIIDRYTKVILTVIAASLMVLAVGEVVDVEPALATSTQVRCTGNLTANAFGGAEPIVGGYSVQVRCR